MNRLTLGLAILLAGCGTTPDGTEMTRGAVLEYVGVDAGTAGPFSNKNLKELNDLSAQDRANARSLFDRGAVAFLVFVPNQGTRIVFVLRGKVVGDFRAANAAPATRTSRSATTMRWRAA